MAEEKQKKQQQQQQQEEENPSVFMFASPGIGHITPFCELARRLICNHSCNVTLMLVKDLCTSAQSQNLLRPLTLLCNNNNSAGGLLTILPLTDIDTGDPQTAVPVRMFTIVESCLQQVLQILQSAEPAPSAFIIDTFCSKFVQPVSEQLGIPVYHFATSSVAPISIMFRVPRLVSQIAVSFKEIEFGIQLPGLPPIAGKHMPYPLLDRSSPAFDIHVSESSNYAKCAGVLVNSFEDLEPEALSGFREIMPNVFPVGPVLWTNDPCQDDQSVEDCVQWLDLQPAASVVYVSFGSGVTLSAAQLCQIAEALEASGHRFLWVVRRKPSSSSSSSSEDQRGDGTYFGISEASARVEGVLPPGFADRTRDRGLIVPGWAPQTWILQHAAVGGFVSHCGWNSTLESIYHGVPILTWPMFAEQRLNAVMVCTAYGVGVDLGVLGMGEFVEADTIERGIRELMEGEGVTQLRKRCSELSCKAKAALQSDGNSWTALDAAVSIWKQQHRHNGTKSAFPAESC